MTEEAIKEQLGLAFLKAASADAGLILNEYHIDYGLDGNFSEVDSSEYTNGHKRYTETGFRIDFQLKSTITLERQGDYWIYDLEAKNYKDLIKTTVGTPRILIVYFLPKERAQWLNVDENSSIMKRSAWWVSLKGEPMTENTSTKRIKIPYNNLITPVELKRLLAMIKGGEEL